MKTATLLLFAVCLMLVLAPVFADGAYGPPVQVSDGAAYMLAPTGLAAIVVIRQSRRRRAIDSVKRGVGIGYYFVKRGVDLLLSTSVLLAASPICAILALLVRLDSPGPIIYKRYVVGKSGRTFPMFKFRTMVDNAEQILQEDGDLRDEYYNGNCKLKVDPRVTRLGKWLRKTSLDELPQLINVVRGEMAFVGPRPIAEDEVELYGPQFSRFTTAKPGITGLWQTSGRSETSYVKRVELDMLYLDKRSISMDLWIIFMTLPAVLLKRGAF